MQVSRRCMDRIFSIVSIRRHRKYSCSWYKLIYRFGYFNKLLRVKVVNWWRVCVAVGSSGRGSAVLGLRYLRHTDRRPMGAGEERTDQDVKQQQTWLPSIQTHLKPISEEKPLWNQQRSGDPDWINARNVFRIMCDFFFFSSLSLLDLFH